MYKVVTCGQMKEIERKAAESGLSYYQMMENAGTAAAELIWDISPAKGKKILVFCGKGNNGGDGFVAARKLWGREADVTVILADGTAKTQDTVKNCAICKELGIEILDFNCEEESCRNENGREVSLLMGQAGIIIDAIYGTGFRGELSDAVRKVTKQINRSKALIFSLDIPSGVNGDSGAADEDSVRAHHTIAFHRYKPAHVTPEALEYCGELHLVPIGIDEMDTI